MYEEYKSSRDKEKYLRGHEREIILFEAAAKALKSAGVSGKLPDVAKRKADYARLQKHLQEYDAARQDVDSILSPACGMEQDKSL